jgi:hypothetical protein
MQLTAHSIHSDELLVTHLHPRAVFMYSHNFNMHRKAIDNNRQQVNSIAHCLLKDGLFVYINLPLPSQAALSTTTLLSATKPNSTTAWTYKPPLFERCHRPTNNPKSTQLTISAKKAPIHLQPYLPLTPRVQHVFPPKRTRRRSQPSTRNRDPPRTARPQRLSA